MSVLFSINFRREAYQREVARARRRVVALGVWVAYFGVLALLAGLYGLNCAAFARRTGMIERQTARLRGSQGAELNWSARQAELDEIERYARSPREWHDRLARLSMILPPNVRLTAIAVNPQNLSTPVEQNRLVLTGTLRAPSGADRMQGVMKIVSALHDDAVFARGYHNIKLASTRVSEDDGGQAEFVIECR